MKISIILVNWNGADDTIECLDSLKCIQYPQFEVLIIDNGSKDDSVNRIKKKHPIQLLLKLEKI